MSREESLGGAEGGNKARMRRGTRRWEDVEVVEEGEAFLVELTGQVPAYSVST